MSLFSKIYKSHIDSSDLYSPDQHSNNPIAEEMQHKLNMESERLRNRLRQELAELQERLSSSPVHLSSTLASIKERLTPLGEQLQSSLSSNVRDLCGQLSLSLQGLETADTRPDARPAPYQEAFDRISQTLAHSTSQAAEIISDFHTEVTEVIKQLKESEPDTAQSELWQEVASRLGQEVSSLRVEVHSRVGALQAELAALLQTEQPQEAEVTTSLERFCQNASLQSQMFQVRMERLFQGLEAELGARGASGLPSSPSSSSSSIQLGGSLQEDFNVKLSALIQDILHSVQ